MGLINGGPSATEFRLLIDRKIPLLRICQKDAYLCLIIGVLRYFLVVGSRSRSFSRSFIGFYLWNQYRVSVEGFVSCIITGSFALLVVYACLV